MMNADDRGVLLTRIAELQGVVQSLRSTFWLVPAIYVSPLVINLVLTNALFLAHRLLQF